MSDETHRPSRLIFFRPPAKPISDEQRLAAARDKAAEYRQAPAAVPGATEHDVQAMDEWADVVSKRIEEAMRRGDFDNLPGRGKPLQIQREPFVPEDQQMAFKLLKNNDMTPAWIAERKEVLRAKERFRSIVVSIAQEALVQWAAAEDDVRRQQVAATWARWIVRWEDEVAELNRRIQTLNLKQPVAHLEVFKIRLDDELRHAGVTRNLA
jgi:hypothetical protein